MASWYDRYRQFAQAQWEPTVLSSQEEAAFREWLIKSKWFQQIRDDVAASGERMMPRCMMSLQGHAPTMITGGHGRLASERRITSSTTGCTGPRPRRTEGC